jgi:UMF1 family MFS transporter
MQTPAAGQPPPPSAAAQAGNNLPTRIEWLPAGSWILYDLANTIYAAVITYVLVPYFTSEFQTATALGVTQTLSMVASGLMMPLMASLCDRTGQTRMYLAVFTLLCIVTMFGWAVWPAKLGLLALLFLGNLGYQNALTFYNALLPSVAPQERTGLVSGLGVGLGYVGTIVTILVALVLSRVFDLGFRSIVACTALLFLLLALPCLLLVRERRVPNHEPATLEIVRERFQKLFQTLAHIRSRRTLLLFFVGSFFLIDVLNTAILYFASYTRDVFTHQAGQGGLFLAGHALGADTLALVLGMLLCGMALVCGVAVGWIGDRYHPLRALRLSGWCLLIGLAGGIFAGGRSTWCYMLSMCVAGAFGLAGIWTAGRQVLLLLAPQAEVGEYTGLYGITNKLSVLGSTTFAVVADWSRRNLEAGLAVAPDVALLLSQKEALLCQLFQIVLGLVCLYGIRVDEVPIPASGDSRREEDPVRSQA